VSTETEQATLAEALADRLPGATLRREDHAVVAVLTDRRIRVESIPGPEGDDRWQVAVSVDGDTVAKHGPFASPTAVVDRAATLAAESVGYTVCCDGHRS
jgi:hypothetical protein